MFTQCTHQNQTKMHIMTCKFLFALARPFLFACPGLVNSISLVISAMRFRLSELIQNGYCYNTCIFGPFANSHRQTSSRKTMRLSSPNAIQKRKQLCQRQQSCVLLSPLTVTVFKKQRSQVNKCHFCFQQ